MKHVRILLTIFLIFSIFSCSDDNNPLDPNERELPPLEDEIPYDFLGSGKILFERIGPYPGEYQGFYVIDIDNQQSWGINTGLSANPCLSNDGTKIAYTHYAGSETLYDVHIMDINGSNQKRISDFPGQDRCPVFNDEGSLIVSWGEGFPTSIYTLNPNVLNVTTIRAFTYNEGLQNRPPTGRMTVSKNLIVYAANDWNQNDITIGLCQMKIDGSNFEILMSSNGLNMVESPRFSPDGNYIAYISVGLDPNTFGWDTITTVETMQIRLLNMTDKSSTLIYETDIVENRWSDPGVTISVFLCWSPDGTKILFSKPVAELISYLYCINKDGSQLTQVTSLEGVTDRHISWSK